MNLLQKGNITLKVQNLVGVIVRVSFEIIDTYNIGVGIEK